LKQAGHSADVYEASDRLGGRCWTRRGDFAEQQIAEHGGELIDQGHTHIRHLAQELGLNLDNLLRAQPNGTEDFFYFDGHEYPYSEVLADLNGIYQKLHKDTAAELPDPTATQNAGSSTTCRSSIGSTRWSRAERRAGTAPDVAYNISTAQCSTERPEPRLPARLHRAGQFRIFGKSTKYHVRGGNDQIVAGMAMPSARAASGAISCSSRSSARLVAAHVDVQERREHRVSR
jgi:monoamine oxidase